VEEHKFEIVLSIHPDDIRRDDLNELYAFRDKVLSLIAISAVVPVTMLHKGTFTFPLGDREYELIALEATPLKLEPAPLESLQPLFHGLSLPENLGAVTYFLWQALNEAEPIYRFINLAICMELLTAAESPEPTSKNPRCPNTKCNYVLRQCPKCSQSWKIPNPLRNRASFLLPDDAFRSRVIKARNKVFHGAQHHWQPDFIEEIATLSLSLLLVIRNYVGDKIGLPPITEEELSTAVNAPQITMRVTYTVPEE